MLLSQMEQYFSISALKIKLKCWNIVKTLQTGYYTVSSIYVYVSCQLMLILGYQLITIIIPNSTKSYQISF